MRGDVRGSGEVSGEGKDRRFGGSEEVERRTRGRGEADAGGKEVGSSGVAHTLAQAPCWYAAFQANRTKAVAAGTGSRGRGRAGRGGGRGRRVELSSTRTHHDGRRAPTVLPLLKRILLLRRCPLLHLQRRCEAEVAELLVRSNQGWHREGGGRGEGGHE